MMYPVSGLLAGAVAKSAPPFFERPGSAEDVRWIGPLPRPLLVHTMSPAKNGDGTLHGLFGGGVMGTGQSHDFTLIFGRARAGDERARGDLIALVYDELRRVAGGPDATGTGRPYALAHRGGPRGRDPPAGRLGLRQGRGPSLPVRFGRSGHAGGPRRAREAEGRRPARRGPSPRPAGPRRGLLRGAGGWTSSPSTRPSTGWRSGTGASRRS